MHHQSSHLEALYLIVHVCERWHDRRLPMYPLRVKYIAETKSKMTLIGQNFKGR